MGKCLICLGQIASKATYHDHCNKQLFGSKNQPVIDLRLVDIPKVAKEIVEQKITVPGFQPKISLSLFSTTGEKTDQRLTIMDALGGNYILKPPSLDYPEMPENEQLTMLMAQTFGIRVAPFGLIRFVSGELAYITKRLDRTEENTKIHMLDFAQITDS
jgi:serine/threonine-protein kinase HipA